jgi:hypothetical protein
MRDLILILLFISQIASAQKHCSALFSSLPSHHELYLSTKETEKQMTKILSELSQKELDYLTDGGSVAYVTNVLAFEKNHKSLQSAVVLGTPDSKSGRSLSLFKGDAYFSHYYYTKYGASYNKGRKMPIEKFAQTEPWFKWNEKTRIYSLERSGIVENIVDKVFGKSKVVRLYRGTSLKEAEFMYELAQMSDQEALIVAQKKIKAGAFHGYFFTNKKSAAKDWSKDDTVVSVDIPREVVLQLAREGRIYAGVEGEYFEFMFFDPTTIKSLANLYQLEK